MTAFEPGDLVEVPFPFIEAGISKLRPALVLSTPEFQRHSGACVLSMITSAERSHWENDCVLEFWAEAGLHKPSLVRWKIFTLDEALIQGRRGHLAASDRAKIGQALNAFLSAWK